MNTRSKFNQDYEVASALISDATNCLKKKIPKEMVAYVLLGKFRYLLDDLTFDQIELLKEDLLDLRDDFDYHIESHLSNLIDLDLEAENYNKRHA